MITPKNTCFVVAVATALMAGAPAIALDGELLIDQAKAGAGGITPADDPGFPITINRSGKYKLTSNLTVPAGANAFNISAGNVTLDLNGFRIAGGRIAINAPNADGLTVMNGTITSFSSDGIRSNAFAIVQDMQIINNGGMGVRLNNNGRVLRSTITASNGVNVFCLSRCLISGNVITRSKTEAGVNLQTSAGGHLVLGNVIADNMGFAIYTEGVMAYANNTITGNGAFGGSSIIGAGAHQAHPNYCEPGCP